MKTFMRDLVAATLLLAACFLAQPSIADTTPHAGLAQGAAKPAPTMTVGSQDPLKATNKWINCQKGDCTGLKIVNVTNYTNRDGVVIDVCPATVKGCSGAVPSNITITDSDFYLLAPTAGDNYPWAVQVVNGSNITLDNVRAHHFQMVAVDGAYKNGDCFDGEVAAHDITISNSLADTCSDGGFDFKSSNLTLLNDHAQHTHYGARLWGKNQHLAGAFTCEDFSEACVQFAPGYAGGVTDNLVIIPGAVKAPIFDIRQGAEGVVKHCEVHDAFGNVVYDGLNLVWRSYQSGATATNTPGIVLDASCSNTPPKPLVTPPPVVVQTPPPAVARVLISKTILKDGSGNGIIVLSTTSTIADLNAVPENKAAKVTAVKGMQLHSPGTLLPNGEYSYSILP